MKKAKTNAEIAHLVHTEQQLDDQWRRLNELASNLHFWRIFSDAVSAPANWAGQLSLPLGYSFKAHHTTMGMRLDDITAKPVHIKKEYTNTVCPNNDPAITARPRWIIDPSGYVYEGLPANRITNVTASIFYQDQQTGQWLLWDASEYGQQNNLQTDDNGAYGWYVPQGKWMVTYQKPGYQTAYSNTYDIPPPATDVNVGLIPLAAPNVTTISASDNTLKIQFSQYMKASTLNQNNIYVTFGGTTISGTVTAFNPQPDPNGTFLTKEARFTPTTPFQAGGTYTVHVDKQVQNFAAFQPTSSYSAEFSIQQAPTYNVSIPATMIPIGGSISALAQTSDPSSKVIAFTWLAPDGTATAVKRVEIAAGGAHSGEFFPYIDGLWTVQVNFTDGVNVLATTVQTFQAVQPIPYTLSLQTTLANATGGFKINSTATNGINLEVPNSSAAAGTPVKLTSFIFLSTPPGRNFTAQLGAVPEEYGQIALNNTAVGGMMRVSLTHQALTQSSSLFYYSNSSQQWIQASNVTSSLPLTHSDPAQSTVTFQFRSSREQQSP
jgi:hypothetical protein